eukprot:TRINITY_DN20609_c0_g2_i2.p1 TRINITY_DN20609_c0_g2~~TRINITY_DN20609_c0_g2_i2.p1  ORF type:complete len:391 (+),score=100.21 TRINITY_DN20609_c0_g2_i2:101-1174(+)
MPVPTGQGMKGAVAAVAARAARGVQKAFHHSKSVVPIFGLGTWRAEPGKVAASVKHALDTGYRHIDMSPRYRNQKEIGEVFRSAFSSGGPLRRSDVFLASKLWNTDHRRVSEALTETLRDLQVDYLDLWYVHWPVALVAGHDSPGDVVRDTEADLQKTWADMEAEVRRGRVRHIAVSNFNRAQLGEILKTATIPPVANQVELHPYLPQGGLVRFCREHGIQVVAYCPIGSPGNAAHNREDVTPLIRHDVVVEVARWASLTPAQVMLKWAMQHNVSVIPKSVTPSRIEENFGALVEPRQLSEDELQQVSSVRTAQGGPVRYCMAKHYFKPGQSPAEFWGDEGGDMIQAPKKLRRAAAA